MLFSPRLPALAVFILVAAATCVRAADAGKVLPADTKVIATLNIRLGLSDHRNTGFIQRYLDQYRLALAGDEPRLRKYFQAQELEKSEGISEREFLARCRVIKSVSDAFGMDPLEDVEQITLGYRGGSDRAGFFVLLIEGRFKEEKLKTALPSIGKDYFGSARALPGGNVWQIPDRPDGVFVTLLDARTLAVTDSTSTLKRVLDQASGTTKNGLPEGMRTLLHGVQKEHVGLVLADADQTIDDLVRFLKDAVARTVTDKEIVGKFIINQGADALQKFGRDISAASLALSLREDDLRLQIGVEAKKPPLAKDLHARLQSNNFLAALSLKAFNNDLAQQLANIVMRQRVILKDTALTTQTEVPYEFIKLATRGPWLALLSKDFAPAGPPAPLAKLGATAVDAVVTRITSIRVWSVPAPDKTKPRPAGTFEIREVPGVLYREGLADPVRNRLDMHLPKDRKDFPVVVLVHGGAWVIGDNRSGGLYSSVGEFLASQGIGAVLPNYRLSPGVKHPAHAQDIARAVAWTHANIARYGGDPKRFYLAGHSAGAHLVSLLATDETYLRDEGMKTANIKGVMAFSGVYRVPPGVMRFSLGGPGPRALRIEQQWPARGDSDSPLPFQLPGLPTELNMFAPVFGDTAAECAAASPVNHVHRGVPPLLIFVAEHDLPTLAEMADEFHQALKQAGCEVRLLRMAKRNHNSLLFSAVTPHDPAAQAMLEFLRK